MGLAKLKTPIIKLASCHLLPSISEVTVPEKKKHPMPIGGNRHIAAFCVLIKKSSNSFGLDFNLESVGNKTEINEAENNVKMLEITEFETFIKPTVLIS